MADEGVFPKSDGDVYYGKDANMTYYNAAYSDLFHTGAVSVGSEATLVVAANSDRKQLLIRNNGNVPIYIKETNSVTMTDDLKLNTGKSIVLYDQSSWYAIGPDADINVRFIEV